MTTITVYPSIRLIIIPNKSYVQITQNCNFDLGKNITFWNKKPKLDLEEMLHKHIAACKMFLMYCLFHFSVILNKCVICFKQVIIIDNCFII